MPTPRFLKAALLAILAALTLAAPAGAADFPVTTVGDEGVGSLRAAVVAAEGFAGHDTITITAEGTINLGSALPVIHEAVDIVGPGADRLTIRRNAAAEFRIFDFDITAPEAARNVSVSGLTVSGGRATEGAGIKADARSLTLEGVTVSDNVSFSNTPGQFTGALGAGIWALGGGLTLRQVTVTGNRATASGGTVMSTAQGGGVAAAAPLLIEASTISGNTTQATGGGGTVEVGSAGLILVNNGTEPGIIDHSTISGNSAHATGGGVSETLGGGVISDGPLIVSGSTITANSATGPGTINGANLLVAHRTIFRDTIVSAPRGGAPSCAAGVTSGGFNIDDGTSCGFLLASDLAATDPGLDPLLALNGGPTATHALLPGSPAIDRGRRLRRPHRPARPPPSQRLPGDRQQRRARRRRLRHRRLRAAGAAGPARPRHRAAPDAPGAFPAFAARHAGTEHAHRPRARSSHPPPSRRLPLRRDRARLALSVQARPRPVPRLPLAAAAQGQARGPARPPGAGDRCGRQRRPDAGALHLAHPARRLSGGERPRISISSIEPRRPRLRRPGTCLRHGFSPLSCWRSSPR